ncbi:calsenilin-like [Watersipora subatra]|uniref:calsenilin-like n=1 Tax=Watersipora subatra TaxID=2589382 RepID=UPI00355BBE59
MYAASSVRSEATVEKRSPKSHMRRGLFDRFLNRLAKGKGTQTKPEDNFADEHDVFEKQVGRHKPESLDNLCRTTKFSKKELKTMYRGFKQECPCGIANEDTFRIIYSQFFPQGDSTAYAHYVFNAFDKDKNGSLSFEEFVMALSMLSRGSVEDKLQWIFSLYDINGDGVVSKGEFLQVVTSIYGMMGSNTDPPINEHSVHEHIARIYERASHFSNEPLSMSQFVGLCQSNDHFLSAIHVFDTQM